MLVANVQGKKQAGKPVVVGGIRLGLWLDGGRKSENKSVSSRWRRRRRG